MFRLALRLFLGAGLLGACGGESRAPAANAESTATAPVLDTTKPASAGAASTPSGEPAAAEEGVLVPETRGAARGARLHSGRAGRVAFAVDRATLFRDPPPVAAVAPEPVEKWRKLRCIPVGQSHLTTAQFFPDQRRLFAVSEADAKLRVYDLRGKLLSLSPLEGYAEFSRGDFLVWPFTDAAPKVLFASDDGIALVDASDGTRLAALAAPGAWTIRLTQGLIAAAGFEIPAQKSSLTLYAASPAPALEPVARFEFDERADDWVMSADRRRLGAVYYPSQEIEWVDLEAGRVLWTGKAPQYAHTLDLSRDETLLAAGGSELRLFDVSDPARQAVFTEFNNNIHRVRFAPAGDAVFASSYDGHVRVLSAGLDTPALTLRKKLRHAGTANVYALDFARDGKLLLSSSGDRSLCLWGRGPLLED